MLVLIALKILVEAAGYEVLTVAILTLATHLLWLDSRRGRRLRGAADRLLLTRTYSLNHSLTQPLLHSPHSLTRLTHPPHPHPPTHPPTHPLTLRGAAPRLRGCAARVARPRTVLGGPPPRPRRRPHARARPRPARGADATDAAAGGGANRGRWGGCMCPPSRSREPGVGSARRSPMMPMVACEPIGLIDI